MTGKRAGLGSPSGTRGRIVDLVRRSPISVTEIAVQLGLTYNAVRGHVSALERDGLIRVARMRRSGTKPSAVYELTPGVEDALSRAYVPFASQLVRTLSERLPPEDLGRIMRDVGGRLAAEWPRPRGTLPERVEAGAAVLQELGAPNEIERDGGVMRIRGFGCLLAAAVHGQPHVCHAMETLLTALLATPVAECCDRGKRPRCCFAIDVPE
jgi:DeoR family suf operon transcriptional repressor